MKKQTGGILKGVLSIVLCGILLLSFAMGPGASADSSKILKAFKNSGELQEDGTYAVTGKIEYFFDKFDARISYDGKKKEMTLYASKPPYYQGGTQYHNEMVFSPDSKDIRVYRFYSTGLGKEIESVSKIDPRNLTPEKELAFEGNAGALVYSGHAQGMIQGWLAILKEQLGLTARDIGFLVYEGYGNDDGGQGDDDGEEITIPATATEGARKVIEYITAHKRTDADGNPCVSSKLSTGSMLSDQRTCIISYDGENGAVRFTMEWKTGNALGQIFFSYYAADGSVSPLYYYSNVKIPETEQTAQIDKQDLSPGSDLFFHDSKGQLTSWGSALIDLAANALVKWNEMLGEGNVGMRDLGFTRFRNVNTGGNRNRPDSALVARLRSGMLKKERRIDRRFYTTTAELIDDTDYDNLDQVILNCQWKDSIGFETIYTLTYDVKTETVANLRLNYGGNADGATVYDKAIDPATFTKDSDMVYQVPSAVAPGGGLQITDWTVAMDCFDDLLHANGFSLLDVGLVAYENSIHGTSYTDGKVEAFVTRCYRLILGREPDEGGMQGWCEALANKQSAAANIIDNFVRSAEYVNRNLSSAESVDILYQAMLNRQADAGGKAGWVDALSKGYSLQNIIDGFCGSAEFTALCNDFGIEPGSVGAPTPASQDTARGKIEAFVRRCYQLILNRDADQGGLQGWSDALETGAGQACQIIDGFVRSPEYVNRNLNNAESVDILYRTMLNRAADEVGKAGWVDALEKGYTLQHIINGFCGSAEFTNICNEFGITAGTLLVQGAMVKREAITPEGDEEAAPVVYVNYTSEYTSEEKVRAFVEHCYEAVFGREGDAEGVEAWTRLILDGKKTPKRIAYEFIFSDEFQNKLPGNEAFIRILYRLYLNREPNADELAGWNAMLENGAGLEEIVNGFAASEEFKAIVNGMRE